MRLCAALLGLSIALGAGLARADEDTGDGWNGEVRLDLSGAYDAARPRAPDGPLVRSGAVTPALTGAYYLQPLVDARELPLGLLEFYQHPGRLSVSLDQETELDRRETEWRTSRRSLGVTAAGTGYPWQDTGLHASIGANYSGVSADTHNSMALAYEAGLVHYFRPNLRGEVSYVGSVSQSSRVVSSTTLPALEDLESARNAGRLAAEAILLQDRLGLAVQLEVGQFTDDRTSNALAGTALPGELTHGLLFSALGTATGYVGRELSISLGGGLRGRTADTQPDLGAPGAVSRTTLTPVVEPSATWFFRDNLFVTVALTLAFPRVDATGAPSSTGSDNTLSGGLALRF